MAKHLLFKMEKFRFKNNSGFSFIEVVAVLFMISIIILILSINTVSSYKKYKEKLALNEVVSDIYRVQTKSLSNQTNYIHFFENSNEYRVYYDGKEEKKFLKEDGKTGTGSRSLKFRYQNGNVNMANTVLVFFEQSSYEIIIHLETGYISVKER